VYFLKRGARGWGLNKATSQKNKKINKIKNKK